MAGAGVPERTSQAGGQWEKGALGSTVPHHVMWAVWSLGSLLILPLEVTQGNPATLTLSLFST